jgi:anti-anti-sigma factor
LPAKRLVVNVRDERAAIVVSIRGEVNALAEGQLSSAYTRAAAAEPALIVLDFEGVSYMNSAGIALIVGLLASARKSGQRLAACCLLPHYVELFEITRLVDYLTVFPDVASAIASAAEGSADR